MLQPKKFWRESPEIAVIADRQHANRRCLIALRVILVEYIVESALHLTDGLLRIAGDDKLEIAQQEIAERCSILRFTVRRCYMRAFRLIDIKPDRVDPHGFKVFKKL